MREVDQVIWLRLFLKNNMKDKILNILTSIDDTKLLVENIDKNSLGASYLKSYKFLISFFVNNRLSESTLIQGVHMIYGWMPKTLNICKNDMNINDVLNSIEKLGDLKNLNKYDLEIVSAFTNNSIVGASKLLHFIYSERFPIWDSKICSKIIEGNVTYQVDKIDNYVQYVNVMSEIKEHPICTAFGIEFKKKNNYDISTMRAAELLVFLSNSN
jgi:hypothetical protein